MKITLTEELKTRCPGAALGYLVYKTEVQPSPPGLLQMFEEKVRELSGRYTLPDIAQLPAVASTRAAYRALGKVPQQYRNSAEAMLRRIVKGEGLYRINNIVDLTNYISFSSGYSLGSYDLSCIQGSIRWHRAPAGETYRGIGKGDLNIEFLPVLYDDSGAFGNPTSDSRRAMIREGSVTVLSVIYAFDGGNRLGRLLQTGEELLQRFCAAETIEKGIFG